MPEASPAAASASAGAQHRPLRLAVERGDGGADHHDLVADATVGVRHRGDSSSVSRRASQAAPTSVDLNLHASLLWHHIAHSSNAPSNPTSWVSYCWSIVSPVGSNAESRTSADAVGEHRRVHGAEVGAVRHAEEADRVVAECCADGVHVPRRVGRGVVLQRAGVLRRTGVGERGLRRVEGGLFLGSVRGVVEVGVLVLLGVRTGSGCRSSGRHHAGRSRSGRGR